MIYRNGWRVSAIAHITHVRNFRSKSRNLKVPKTLKKVDFKRGLGIMNIISVVSKIEHHKKLNFSICFRSRFKLETNIIISRSHLQKLLNLLNRNVRRYIPAIGIRRKRTFKSFVLFRKLYMQIFFISYKVLSILRLYSEAQY